jgi:hypothetical protein
MQQNSGSTVWAVQGDSSSWLVVAILFLREQTGGDELLLTTTSLLGTKVEKNRLFFYCLSQTINLIDVIKAPTEEKAPSQQRYYVQLFQPPASEAASLRQWLTHP